VRSASLRGLGLEEHDASTQEEETGDRGHRHEQQLIIVQGRDLARTSPTIGSFTELVGSEISRDNKKMRRATTSNPITTNARESDPGSPLPQLDEGEDAAKDHPRADTWKCPAVILFEHLRHHRHTRLPIEAAPALARTVRAPAPSHRLASP
jgi:hypothetical protein